MPDVAHIRHTVQVDDQRAYNLGFALGAYTARNGLVALTEARARKWKLLYDADFDAHKTPDGRYWYTRRGGPQVKLDVAVIVAEAVAETRKEKSFLRAAGF